MLKKSVGQGSLEADALVLSRGAVERRLPARVSRSGDVTLKEDER